MRILTFAFLVCTLYSCIAQPNNTSVFFPKPLEVGSYYYPEHWDESEWERDLKKMSELGFTFTHFGEFAWSQMEPTEGNYDFSWLDNAIELAHKNNLKVILCTPTPTPPAWLTQNHPEVLMVNEDGRTIEHGGRQQASWSSPVYKEYVEKIVTALGKRYGKDERVWGWQLDNEPSHYNQMYDYGEAAQSAFRSYIKAKYSSIDSLNKRWGNDFWSQNYNSFEQIRIPNGKTLVAQPNPHALLDFQEFNNGQLIDFLGHQADVLRNYCLPEQFITTNYMLPAPHVDPFPGKDRLDFASYTKYPISSYEPTDEGPLGFRLGSAYHFIFNHKFAESVNGYTGVMELQPGQVNWGAFNSQPLPGAVRMWVWHAYAMGCTFICNYRFRQPVYGCEQYHQGIILPDGVSVARGGQEYVQAIEEFNEIIPETPEASSHPRANGRTAILWDRKSVLDQMNYPHNNRWDPMSQIFDYIQVLESMNVPYEFVTADELLDPKAFPFLIIPSVQLVNDNMISQWTKYAEQGGHILMSCRTAQKNRDGHLWRANPQEPIENLVGAEFEFYDHLPPNRSQSVSFDGQTYDWDQWGDVLKITNRLAKPIALHQDAFYKGRVAATQRKLIQGSVTYIGTRSKHHALETAITRKLYSNQGVNIEALPPYVILSHRDGLSVLTNYSSEVFSPTLPNGADVLLGKSEVKPGQVLVWKQKP